MILRRAIFAVILYFICWVVAYCAMMLSCGDSLSLELLVSYFKLAWTFSAGELPSFIWLFSVVLYTFAIGAWVLISRRRRFSGQRST